MGTLIAGIILVIIVIIAVLSYIKQIKKGGCGCNCAKCSRNCTFSNNKKE